MSEQKKCEVCRWSHPTENHKCVLCGVVGKESHHFSKCPNKCQLRKSCVHLPEQHVCTNCGKVGLNSHNEVDCPEPVRQKPITITEKRGTYKYHEYKDENGSQFHVCELVV
jgi:hypothetical protein